MTYTDKKRKSWSYSLTLTAAIVGATLAGGMYGNRLFGSPVQDELQQRFKEYTDLLSAAEQWSPEDLGPDKLVFSSVEGMLRTLDPHTSFFEPTEYSEMQDRQKGTFYGLGILVTKRNEQVTVITPLEGTPASRLGKASHNSPVMVMAWWSASPTRARASRNARSSSAKPCHSGQAMVAVRTKRLSSTRAAFRCAPPMSQPMIVCMTGFPVRAKAATEL